MALGHPIYSRQVVHRDLGPHVVHHRPLSHGHIHLTSFAIPIRPCSQVSIAAAHFPLHTLAKIMASLCATPRPASLLLRGGALRHSVSSRVFECFCSSSVKCRIILTKVIAVALPPSRTWT